MRTSHTALLLLSASMLALNAVKAAYISIDDTNPDDTITITASQFGYGFIVNGQQIQYGYGTASITLPESGPLNFFGMWIDNGPSSSGHRTIYLVEPGDPTLISDVLDYGWLTYGNFRGEIWGQFWSDVGNDLGRLPAGVDPADVFVENGQAVGFSVASLSGVILSDVESVPEHGGFALLPMSLGAIGFCARLLRKPAKV